MNSLPHDHPPADDEPYTSDPMEQRQMALSRWDNEGGAGFSDFQVESTQAAVCVDVPRLTDAELVQLRVRVVALENLVIALLAEGCDRQLDLVREMAAYISPRPGFTHHPLTVHAASRMRHLAQRAVHFRVTPQPGSSFGKEGKEEGNSCAF